MGVKTIFVCIFSHAVTDCRLCAGQSLCDPGHSSLVSFQTDTERFKAALENVHTMFREIFQHFLSAQILDRNLSHNLVMKHIPGADPELVLLNHYYEELDVRFSFVLVLSFLYYFIYI